MTNEAIANNTRSPKLRFSSSLAPLLLATLIFLPYYLALTSGTYPGESSSLVATHLELRPRLSPANPIWNALLTVVAAHLPFFELGFRLNLLSAILAAFSLFLLFRIIYHATMAVFSADTLERIFLHRCALTAAFAGTTFLAFSPTFWILATRAHHLPLDLVMLLSATSLLISYWRKPSAWKPPVFALLYGIGTVEFSTFIVFAPLFGAALLALMFHAESLTPRRFLWLVLAALAGLSLYFFFAWQFVGTEGYYTRDYKHYLNVVWTVWQDQYFELARSLPRVGWLIILCLTTVPWLTMLFVAKWSLNHSKTWDNYLLHAVLTAAVLMVLFNAKGTPWSVLGASRLLVTPYVLSAIVFAYLVAYWYSVPVTLWWGYSNPTRKWLQPRLGFVLITPLLAAVLTAPFLNAKVISKTMPTIANSLARDIVRSLEGRQWLISDGWLDNNILIAAHDLNIPVKLLNLRLGENEVYMRYVARMFDDVRLKNLCTIGLMPMLNEWISTDPTACDKIAVQSLPDLFVSAGFTIVPNRTVFLGMRGQPTDADQRIRAHDQFWKDNAAFIRSLPEQTPDDTAILKGVLRHMGFVANNLGVLMEELKRDKDAFHCYTTSRELDPSNVSALLNQSVMLDRGYKSDAETSIRAEVEALLRDTSQRHELWKLSRYYGYVRNPLAYASIGLTWARSGQPGLAVAGLKKAMELLPEDQRADIKQRLAAVYLAQDMPQQSEQTYKELLKTNPTNTSALIGMTRMALRSRNIQEARAYLKKAQEAGANATAVAIESATILMAAGDLAQARIQIQEVIDLKPNAIQAWLLLVDVLTLQKDAPALEQMITKLERMDPPPEIGLELARGNLLLLQNDYSRAAEHFERVIARNPTHYRSMQILLRLDMVRGMWNSAFERAGRLLKLNPNDPVGNYVTGVLQMKEGDMKLAEDSFRKSLSVAESFEASNDLAWLLQERGKMEEAEQLARRAIAIDEKMPQPWDTLGVILMKIKKIDQAEHAFERSLSLSQADMRTFIHMAQIKAIKGEKDKVAELLDMLNQNRHRIPAEDQNAIAELRENLKK